MDFSTTSSLPPSSSSSSEKFLEGSVGCHHVNTLHHTVGPPASALMCQSSGYRRLPPCVSPGTFTVLRRYKAVGRNNNNKKNKTPKQQQQQLKKFRLRRSSTSDPFIADRTKSQQTFGTSYRLTATQAARGGEGKVLLSAQTSQHRTSTQILPV